MLNKIIELLCNNCNSLCMCVLDRLFFECQMFETTNGCTGDRGRERDRRRRNRQICVLQHFLYRRVFAGSTHLFGQNLTVSRPRNKQNIYILLPFLLNCLQAVFFCPLFLMKLPAINDTQYACEAHWRQAKRGAPMRIIDYYSIIISLQTHNIVTILPYSPLCRVA